MGARRGRSIGLALSIRSFVQYSRTDCGSSLGLVVIGANIDVPGGCGPASEASPPVVTRTALLSGDVTIERITTTAMPRATMQMPPVAVLLMLQLLPVEFEPSAAAAPRPRPERQLWYSSSRWPPSTWSSSVPATLQMTRSDPLLSRWTLRSPRLCPAAPASSL